MLLSAMVNKNIQHWDIETRLGRIYKPQSKGIGQGRLQLQIQQIN